MIHAIDRAKPRHRADEQADGHTDKNQQQVQGLQRNQHAIPEKA
jgi:hypothetical protein